MTFGSAPTENDGGLSIETAEQAEKRINGATIKTSESVMGQLREVQAGGDLATVAQAQEKADDFYAVNKLVTGVVPKTEERPVLHDAQVGAFNEANRVAGIEADERAREAEKAKAVAINSDVLQIFSSARVMNTPPEYQKANLVKGMISVLKNVSGRDGGMNNVAMYLDAFKENSGTLFKTDAEKAAFSSLVESFSTSAGLSALTSGEIKEDQRLDIKREALQRGMSDEDASQRVANLVASRNQLLVEARKNLEKMGVDPYSI